MDRYLMVTLGGALGSLARYVVGTAVMNRVGGRFPLGTALVNISGSFLVGFLMTMLAQRRGLHDAWRLILVVGFLGGYTTFSALEWESFVLMRKGAAWLALLNLAGSVLVGYLSVLAGASIAGKR